MTSSAKETVGRKLTDTLITEFKKYLPGEYKVLIHDTHFDLYATIHLPSDQKERKLMICGEQNPIHDTLISVAKHHNTFTAIDVSFTFDEKHSTTTMRLFGAYQPVSILMRASRCGYLCIDLLRHGMGEGREEEEDEKKSTTGLKRRKHGQEGPMRKKRKLDTPTATHTQITSEIERCLDNSNVTSPPTKRKLRPIIACLCTLNDDETPSHVKCMLNQATDYKFELTLSGYDKISHSQLMLLHSALETHTTNAKVSIRLDLVQHLIELRVVYGNDPVEQNTTQKAKTIIKK